MAAQYQHREHFIPYRKPDIVEMCLADNRLSASDQACFRDFCRILESIIHFEFHQQLEDIKACYAPFNPDADTRKIREASPENRTGLQKKLVASMARLLKAANYEQITETDLQEALKEESVFNIRLEVNFEDFEEVIFYRRGRQKKQETIFRFFGLKKNIVEFTNYERVAIYIKFRDAEYFRSKKRSTLYFTPGSTVIKLFQNVPKADLEMLFPNSEVRMKTLDKIIIGVPAAVGGVIVLMTKLSASLLLIFSLIAFWMGFRDQDVSINQHHLVTLGAGLATLGGFIFKQVGKFRNRQIKFMKALSDSLYFRNLDNNAGVFHHLIDAAEEEEVKEAVLAYYFLLAENRDFTVAELDDYIEEWFERQHDCRLDFEIEDAVQKLERLGIVSRNGDVLRPLSPDAARAQLDMIWDNYFPWHQPGEKNGCSCSSHPA